MTVGTDSWRRPVYIDRRNSRLFAEPLIGNGAWPEVPLSLTMFGVAPANTLVGRYGSSGSLSALSADVTIDLINTATTSTIGAARVVAGSTSGAGVLQLTDSTASTSTTTAATPNAVKAAYDLGNAALPRTGGTMTGAITFAAGQTISGYLPLAGGTLTGDVTLNGQSDLRFADADSSNWIALQAPSAIASNVTLTLPATDGGSGQALSTNGSGALGWTSYLPSAGGTLSGAVTFASGQAYPQIPANSQTSAYILVASDAGKHINITTGGVTVPSGVFSAGDAISIYNNSGSNQTITQGGSVTLRQAGTANTGNRTLAQYGIATVLCVASNTFVISGAGLS